MSTLGWQSALLFLFAIIVAICMLSLIADWAYRRFICWRDVNHRRVSDRRRWELIRPYEPSSRQKRY